MAYLLPEIKDTFEKAKSQKLSLTTGLISEYESRYDALIEEGIQEAVPPPISEEQPKKRGRVKQGKPLNLLLRLKEHKDAALVYMNDVNVPFDNNWSYPALVDTQGLTDHAA